MIKNVNITSKVQNVTQTGITFNGTLNAGYSLSYSYKNGTHQIDTLGDTSYRNEVNGVAGGIRKNDRYSYDANGNLIYINTARYKKNGSADSLSNIRKLLWDEENRLLAVDDNGYVSNYWYDASGERTVKTSGESEGIYVLGAFSGGRTNTADFTLYVNPYMVVNKGGRYTKHIYIGSERIVSKLGDLGSFGADPRRVDYAGVNTDVTTPVPFAAMYDSEQAQIKARYDTLHVPYNGTNNDDYVNGIDFCCGDTGIAGKTNGTVGTSGNITGGNDNPEIYQYFYHSDHLGSSTFITNLDGEVAQHVEYVPFGEVFLEERDTIWNTPYKFNGKELDEETGLYYYGARYYNPRSSLWLSVDPMQEKYAGVSPFCYTLGNPVNLIDPKGMAVDDDHFDLRGHYLYTDKRKTNNIVIDVLFAKTPFAVDVQLKDFRFDEKYAQTLMNIGNYYAKKAGVNMNNLRGKSVSLAMWNNQVFEGGAPDRNKGEFTTYNNGDYCYDCLVQSNKVEKTISLQVNNYRISSKLNDKYNLMSTLQHEGGANVPSHFTVNTNPFDESDNGQRNEHLKIYDYQINKSPIFQKTTPAFQKYIKEIYEDVKAGATGN